MKKNIRYILVMLLIILNLIGLISISKRIDNIEARVKYIDSKRIELENKVEDLERDYKLYEINLSNLKKNAKAQFCGGEK